MADTRRKRVEEFIEPLRAAPGFDPGFPPATQRKRETLLDIRQTLEARAPKGAAPDPFEQQLRDGTAGSAEWCDGRPVEPAVDSSGPDKPGSEGVR